MDVRNTPPSLDTLLTQFVQNKKLPATKPADAASNIAPIVKGKNAARQPDNVDLSNNKSNNVGNNGEAKGFAAKQTRLVSEDIEPLENGFRRRQEFENTEGRTFSRVEEVITENDRTSRTVIQQNASGTTTIFENILDRQEDGSFRLTERYTDETGKTNTNIKLNTTPDNEDIILGRPPAPEQSDQNPFRLTRGTQFDVSA
jgi:hypothetical protein